MNKKVFTLIELIAVVVIMAIIALIATPNIVNMMDRGKKEDYVADAKEIITKATYMYKKEKTSSTKKFLASKDDEGNTIYTISLENIEGINDYTDPYGFTYDKEKSTVKFEEPNTTGELAERVVYITLISNKDSECYTIDNIKKNDLNTEKVKQGTWNATGCEVTTP